jgi:hypothetical protein
MLLLIATTAVAAVPPPPRPAQVQARAIVRIMRPAIASSKAWELSPKGARKETIRRDERGEPVLLRLIEYP